MSFDIAWDKVNWPLVQQRVLRVQRRIYKARLSGNLQRVHWLQKLLLHSIDAKLLAVFQVTTLNKGRRTPGVDKQTATDKKQKEMIVKSLVLDGKASPIRRVWIPKPGTEEKRPLGIPTIKDRAKQALAKLAIEPEWEAVFEPNSYGFRPGRRSQDAIEAIFLSLHHKTPKWIYDADIRKCFDRISHQGLLEKLNTFPEMENQIQAWLSAGIMDILNTQDNDPIIPIMGTPQGGIISPLLANIALHGLEHHLKEFVGNLIGNPRETANRGKAAKQKALSIIRYADDFVLIHSNKDILEKCVIETQNWLTKIGLEINTEKSALKDGRQGFLFLGFQIIQITKSGTYKVKIRPSRKSQARFLLKVREIVQQNKAASAYQLISKLRPVIIGWGNYFKYCECSVDFSSLSHMIFQKIRAWVFRRDTRNGRLVIKQKYFPSDKEYSFAGTKHKDNWVLAGTYKSKHGTKTNFLPHLIWVKSKKYVKVKSNKSPYDGDNIYWATRSGKYSSLSIRQQTLLKRQNTRCAMCGTPFSSLDVLEVDHIIPKNKGGKDIYSNLQILHRFCHIKKTQMDGIQLQL